MKRLAPVFLAAITACGFLFTQAPPAGHEHMDYFTCTESDVGPILDVVWGGLNLVGAVIIASDREAYESPDAAIVSGLAWSILSGSAAAVGFNRVKQCRAAKGLLAQRQSQNHAAPVATGPNDPAAVQTVVVTPPADTLAIGATLQLVATAYHSSGVAIPGRSFTWSSSNDAVASVSNAGLVTANAPGMVVIAANTGNVVGTARLVVVAARE
jgi:hypothetical protein